MYKKIFSSFLLAISIESFSWELVYISMSGREIAAWIPESRSELDAAIQANARAIAFAYANGLSDIAYIFFREFMYPQGDKHSFQFNGAPAATQQIITSQLSETFSNPASIGSGLLEREEGCLTFNHAMKEPAKYCKEFAFDPEGCQRKICKHLHINKKDFKKRVVCFQQILGRCSYKDCRHRHLLSHQLRQLQEARLHGIQVPIIFCDEEHSDAEEERNCPYLHLTN